MKYIIKYYDIEGGASYIAFPQFTRREFIECETDEALEKYILSKTDAWGHPFKKKESFGFDYISVNGAVIIEIYHAPKFQKI